MVHSVLLGLTCLFHGLRAADGQVAADRQWRIVNAEPLAGFWSVVEVEFHSSSSCNEIVGGAPIASGSVLISLSGAHDVSLAVDGISTPVVSAGWWSDCGYVLGDPTNFGGGCAVGEAWIGMDSGFTTFETKCVRLMQPADSNHSASTIGLDRWDGSSWVRIKTFVNTGGVEAEGRFLDLTVDPDSKWRVKPLLAEANWDPWPTSSEWAVAELQLFDNVECREPALSARFSGSGFVGDGVTASDATYSPSLAQDGDLATAWAAPCPSGVACGSEGAWLEAQLQVPSVVRCLRLFQATTAASAVVSLESGSGTVYTNVSRFSQLSGGAWEHLARWEVANKALGSMWRLVPTGVGPQAWRVIEIELFAAENCSLPLAFDSFASGGLGMALAGDGDLTTAWQAASLADSGAWLGRYEGTETLHRLGWPWLGLSTADGVVPLCLRLLQGNESSRFANDVVLQRWSGSSWLDYQVSLSGIGTIAPHFLELGTGLSYLPETWARLPFLDRLQWRVQALDVMLNSWALKELQFYEAIDCQQEVEGLPIAAGQDPMEPSRNASLAFDQNQLTDWWSVCTRCLKGAAWIGQAVARARNIRCFRLFQSSLPAHGNAEAPWFTGLVSLDKWNGNRWATLETFSGLSRGVWEQKLIYSHSPLAQDSASVLPYWVTEAERLWRVTTLDNLPRRWYVGSVSFFWDLACSTPILDANIIASGWALGFEAENAFGQNVSIRSEWASACDGCGSQQAWLGLALPLPSWPRCVQIFQTPRTGFGSRLLSVERFDGSAWVSVAQKASTPTAWETIELPGPGQAYSVPYPVRVAPDGVSFAGRIAWRLVAKGPNRRGWQVSGLRIFSDLSCRDEVSGIVTASGFADGHEPELAVGSNDTSTFWEASCTQCTDQGTLGVSLTTETILPRCFQLYQPDDSWAASSISIQVLEETDEGETWLERVPAPCQKSQLGHGPMPQADNELEDFLASVEASALRAQHALQPAEGAIVAAVGLILCFAGRHFPYSAFFWRVFVAKGWPPICRAVHQLRSRYLAARAAAEQEMPPSGFSQVRQSMQGLANRLQRLTAGVQQAQSSPSPVVSDLTKELQGLQHDLAEVAPLGSALAVASHEAASMGEPLMHLRTAFQQCLGEATQEASRCIGLAVNVGDAVAEAVNRAAAPKLRQLVEELLQHLGIQLAQLREDANASRLMERAIRAASNSLGIAVSCFVEARLFALSNARIGAKYAVGGACRWLQRQNYLSSEAGSSPLKVPVEYALCMAGLYWQFLRGRSGWQRVLAFLWGGYGLSWTSALLLGLPLLQESWLRASVMADRAGLLD